MPEGDVVRRTAARLHEALAGRPLVHAELRWSDLGGVDLAGRVVTGVVAYGKHLFIHVEAATGAATQRIPAAPAAPLTVHSHLKMDGQWFIRPTVGPERARLTDHRVSAVLANAEWTAVGTLLGALDLVPTAEEHRLVNHLGPDVMADDFPTAGLPVALRNLATDPRRHIGAALLDQTVVAGLGTIFMAESLFRQRVSPWAEAGEVDGTALVLCARKLLLLSAQAGYPRPEQAPPQLRRFVHDRAGKRCFRCGATIRVAPVGTPPYDRPAFFCPGCILVGPAAEGAKSVIGGRAKTFRAQRR